MNQRSRNRRRHATVLFRQLVERRNSRRIAQHHGDLTTTGNAGGLALSAGLGLAHGSIRLGDFVHGDELGAFLGEHVHHIECRAPLTLRRNVIRHSFQRASVRSRVGADHAVKIHGHLRSGEIPPMSESYTVTSDVSTTILRAGL